jgi:hypothetical protein
MLDIHEHHLSLCEEWGHCRYWIYFRKVKDGLLHGCEYPTIQQMQIGLIHSSLYLRLLSAETPSKNNSNRQGIKRLVGLRVTMAVILIVNEWTTQ